MALDEFDSLVLDKQLAGASLLSSMAATSVAASVGDCTASDGASHDDILQKALERIGLSENPQPNGSSHKIIEFWGSFF